MREGGLRGLVVSQRTDGSYLPWQRMELGTRLKEDFILIPRLPNGQISGLARAYGGSLLSRPDETAYGRPGDCCIRYG
jgi:hypothetical protein